MNERHGHQGGGHDGYGGTYELVGHDESGQPVYRLVPAQGGAPRTNPSQQSYEEQWSGDTGQDPYGRQPYQPQAYADRQQSYEGRPYAHEDPSYGQQPSYGQDPSYGQEQSHGQEGYGRQQPGAGQPQDQQQPYVPQWPDGSAASSPGPGPGTLPGQDAPAYDTPAYDPPAYGTARQPRVHDTGQQPTYGAPQAPAYGRAAAHDTGQLPARDHRSVPDDPYAALGEIADRDERDARQAPGVPGQRGDGRAGAAGAGRGGSGEPYETEQFAFVEDEDDKSEDVIDWLKFTESRTERREEARRRGRARRTLLICVLVLALVGTGGWLWFTDRIPGLGGDGPRSVEAGGPQNRDMILVHLHHTRGGGTSTALLVDNSTTGKGTTVLLPNSLSVGSDDGTTTTLAKSVDEDGSTGTSASVDGLLGTDVQGSWRLDTPYLSNLVELVGNIEVDADTDVPDPKAKKGEGPLVHKGPARTLSGEAAVAYATYRAASEDETAQLARFGQVLQAVLRKLSSDPQAATTTMQTLLMVLDPPLSEGELGAFLAKLADRAKSGDYTTSVLPVQSDGTLAEKTTERVVKEILGGKVRRPDKDAAVRVSVRAEEGPTGDKDLSGARVSLVNGGWSFVGGGRSAAPARSEVTYADAERKAAASEIAKTLNLPPSAIRKGKVPANADVSVTLGEDFEPPTGG